MFRYMYVLKNIDGICFLKMKFYLFFFLGCFMIFVYVKINVFFVFGMFFLEDW